MKGCCCPACRISAVGVDSVAAGCQLCGPPAAGICAMHGSQRPPSYVVGVHQAAQLDANRRGHSACRCRHCTRAARCSGSSCATVVGGAGACTVFMPDVCIYLAFLLVCTLSAGLQSCMPLSLTTGEHMQACATVLKRSEVLLKWSLFLFHARLRTQDVARVAKQPREATQRAWCQCIQWCQP
jgi:hypothetical protein